MSRGVSKKNKEKLLIALAEIKKKNDVKPSNSKDRSNSAGASSN